MSLLDAIIQFAGSSWDLLKALAVLIGASAPILAWMAWWLFAVDWAQFREVIRAGAWVGVLLIAVLAVIVWTCADPASSELLGIPLPSIVAKAIVVGILIFVAFACGVVQLQWKSWKSCPTG